MCKVTGLYLSKQLDVTLMLTEAVSARTEARHLGIVGGPRLAIRAVESILGRQSVRENEVLFFFKAPVCH